MSYSLNLYLQKYGGKKELGTLVFDNENLQDEIRFLYAQKYLSNPELNLLLHREIPLKAGWIHLSLDNIKWLLDDLKPDGWGNLIKQRFISSLNLDSFELEDIVSYLLTNQDALMGNIRYDVKYNNSRKFEFTTLTTPTIEQAIRDTAEIEEIEKDNEVFPSSFYKLQGFSSQLNGQRPKINYIDQKGERWVGKHPSINDSINLEAWEATTLTLAKLCGLEVGEYKLEKTKFNGGILFYKRFDRVNNQAIGFMSGSRAVRKDVDDETASYDDLVSFIKAYGSSPKSDLKELFSRIAFNIAINNGEDHLLNVAFLLNNLGWKLSPLFDVVPSIYSSRLRLKIGGVVNSMSYASLLKHHKTFYLTESEAISIIKTIERTVKSHWISVAKTNMIPVREITNMSLAFSNQLDI